MFPVYTGVFLFSYLLFFLQISATLTWLILNLFADSECFIMIHPYVSFYNEVFYSLAHANLTQRDRPLVIMMLPCPI